MHFQKSCALVLVCLVALSGNVTFARQPNLPAAFSVQSGPASQTDPLAVVDDRTVTLDDIDPRVRELSNLLDSEIKDARNQVLAKQIDTLLFEAEAARRRITMARLLAVEITQRTVDPSAAEIQAIYDANRAQFGTTDLIGARPQIVAYLRRESEQKLAADLAATLRKRFGVVMGTNINSPDLASNATLATVAGRVILAGPLIERLKPVIYDLQLRVYEAFSNAVEQMIDTLLVLDEARREGVGPEVIVKREVTDKLRAPSEEEITKYFEMNKARMPGDLDSARASIASYLGEQDQARLIRAYRDKLRKGKNVRINLRAPVRPVIAVSTDDDPSRGPATAPVTVVVFTDFQCPSCGANHPLIEEVIKSYGDKVRFVIRDFPLSMHENAQKAAEAANAANAQGKFFEYIELLFKNQKALDIPSLKKYATEIGLNRIKFDAALDGGVFELEVKHDVDDGVQYGVSGTPTVFVNGARVINLSAETLRAEIDSALAPKKAS
jgi:protein-disulfide isomerase